MMKDKIRSYNHAFKVQDEYRTPKMLVTMLLPDFVKWAEEFEAKNNRKPIIWCPFDKSESNYVTVFKNAGYEVINSHVDEGKDFFDFTPSFDIAISNPPFSLKLPIFQRLQVLDKPFIMLMNMMAINYQEIGEFFYFVGTKIQFLIPDKKVSFNGGTSSFCSGYVCYKFLDKTKFVHLEHNNTGNNFNTEA